MSSSVTSTTVVPSTSFADLALPQYRRTFKMRYNLINSTKDVYKADSDGKNDGDSVGKFAATGIADVFDSCSDGGATASIVIQLGSRASDSAAPTMLKMTAIREITSGPPESSYVVAVVIETGTGSCAHVRGTGRIVQIEGGYTLTINAYRG